MANKQIVKPQTVSGISVGASVMMTIRVSLVKGRPTARRVKIIANDVHYAGPRSIGEATLDNVRAYILRVAIGWDNKFTIIGSPYLSAARHACRKLQSEPVELPDQKSRARNTGRIR